MPGLMPPAEPDPPRSPLVEDDHPAEAHRQAGEPVDRDHLVEEEQRRDDDREQRHGRVQDRRDRGIDAAPFPVRDEPEGDHDREQRHDQQVAIGAPAGRERRSDDQEDADQQQGPEQEPQHDEGERLQTLVDADLDEQVAAAPHEGQEEEQRPVERRPGGLRRGGDGLRGTLGRHRPHDSPRWPTGLGQKRAGAPG